MLVVVEYGDRQALAQFLLDVETLGRLDVFQVDAAQRGLQRGNDVDQLVRIAFVQFDVEHVDAGKFLEQAAFAFHHRLAGEGADIAQAQYGRAVGNHTDQVATRRIAGGQQGVFFDGQAGRRHAWRVSQRQIALVGQALGRRDRDFSGVRMLVIVERGVVKCLIHQLLLRINF